MKNEKLIKEDLFEIYKTLKDITANEVTSKMFSKDFLKKFKYSVEDIYTVLELNNAENIKTTLEIKLNEKIINIRDLDSLRTFYYQNLAEICNAQVE